MRARAGSRRVTAPLAGQIQEISGRRADWRGRTKPRDDARMVCAEGRETRLRMLNCGTNRSGREPMRPTVAPLWVAKWL